MAYTPNMRRPVPSYPGWEADEDGKVYRDGNEVLGWVAQKYIWVYACGKSIKRSYLVAYAFIGIRPDGMELCHIDDIQSNDAPSNLKWDTHTGNVQDSILNGTHYYPNPSLGGKAYRPNAMGQNHYKATLHDIDVMAMRDDFASGEFTRRQIAKMYGQGYEFTCAILRGDKRADAGRVEV